jgi:hypothetical protein
MLPAELAGAIAQELSLGSSTRRPILFLLFDGGEILQPD